MNLTYVSVCRLDVKMLLLAAALIRICSSCAIADDGVLIDQELSRVCYRLDFVGAEALLRRGASPKSQLNAGALSSWWIPASESARQAMWTPLMATCMSEIGDEGNVGSPDSSLLSVWARDFLKSHGQQNATNQTHLRLILAKLLITSGAELNADDGFGGTPLLAALLRRDEALAQFLLESGADPNATWRVQIDDKSNMTPLHFATWSPKCVEQLIAKGAKVNAVDSKGRTPLHEATAQGCIGGGIDAVKLLVDAGADAGIEDRTAVSPRETASVGARLQIGSFGAINEYLIKKPVNEPTPDADGSTDGQ